MDTLIFPIPNTNIRVRENILKRTYLPVQESRTSLRVDYKYLFQILLIDSSSPAHRRRGSGRKSRHGGFRSQREDSSAYDDHLLR